MPPEPPPDRPDDHTWAVLTALHEDVPTAVVIGGWATWLRTRGLVSHDIDLIVTRAELAQIIAIADEISESRHLAGRKWRGTINEVHVDLYVPHQSRLGARLRLRIERLLPHVEIVDGWTVLSRPAHFVTKMAALLDRPDSLPGQKDRRELLALLRTGLEADEVMTVLAETSEVEADELPGLVHETFTYLAEDGMDKAERRRLRAAASSWVKALP